MDLVGRTSLPNRLEEAIIHARFSSSQLKVVRCIARLTVGSRRRTVAISIPRLAVTCGRKYTRGFRDQVDALIRNGGIVKTAPATGRHRRATR